MAPRTLPRTRIPYKKKHLKELLAVPGIGSVNSPSSLDPLCIDVEYRVKVAKALYEAGCDTVAKLHLEQYYKMLPPKVKRTFKHFEYLGAPVPRENAERIMVRYCSPTYSDHELKITNLCRNFANFSCLQTDSN